MYLGRQPGEERDVRRTVVCQGERVVRTMVSPFDYTWYNSGHNVVGDNFFTGTELTEELLRQGLTYVGTMRHSTSNVVTESKRVIVGICIS